MDTRVHASEPLQRIHRLFLELSELECLREKVRILELSELKCPPEKVRKAEAEGE